MKALLVAFGVLVLLASPARAHGISAGSIIGPESEQKKGDYVYVWRSVTVPRGYSTEVEAVCPQGYIALSGGYRGDHGFFYVRENRPNASFDGWVLDANAGSAYDSVTLTVYATCGPPTK
jgi:hypothetical protein